MTRWYAKRGEKQFGPFDEKQLRELARSRKLHPDDQIRGSEDNQWVTARYSSGLRFASRWDHWRYRNV